MLLAKVILKIVGIAVLCLSGVKIAAAQVPYIDGQIGGHVNTVEAAGDIVFVTYDGALQIIDCIELAKPTLLGTWTTLGGANANGGGCGCSVQAAQPNAQWQEAIIIGLVMLFMLGIRLRSSGE